MTAPGVQARATLLAFAGHPQLDEVQIAAEVEPLPWPGHEHSPWYPS